MSYGNQQGGLDAIGPVQGVNPHNYTSPTNYYAQDKIAATSESARYVQNMNPSSISYMSKTFIATGLNPFQNNFSEQILKYQDDGTILTGRTIGIG